MNREQVQKLLGGYATGTLTPEEQQTLFAAALEDQELFDALGREQALRDLLRDPAAKAELLAALDEPKSRGFWAWLRRPMVAGLATAAVAAVAIIAVWQGTRGKVALAPVMVAEVKVPEKTSVSEPVAAPVVVQDAPAKRKAGPATREAVNKDFSALLNVPTPAPVAPPPPAAAPAPLPSQPASMGALADTVQVTGAAPALPVQGRTLEVEKLTQDARSLFYGNSFLSGANAPAPSAMGSSAGAQSVTMRAAVAKKESAVPSLGVRVSILRGDGEAAMTTVLDPGESVRLKLTPNADGFLYVAARDNTGWKMVASAPAERFKPFETPALLFEGSGQKQLYVMLSRQPRTLSPQALAGMARANLVETLAGQDRATYVVDGLQSGATQQVVQPITLTYK